MSRSKAYRRLFLEVLPTWPATKLEPPGLGLSMADSEFLLRLRPRMRRRWLLRRLWSSEVVISEGTCVELGWREGSTFGDVARALWQTVPLTTRETEHFGDRAWTPRRLDTEEAA